MITTLRIKVYTNLTRKIIAKTKSLNTYKKG